MKEFLQPCKKNEYPTEYLLARLRGRSAGFLKDWDNLVMHSDPEKLLLNTRYGDFISAKSGEGIWKCALKEFNWVYCQMNFRLTELLNPFFIFLELRTLMICLRYKVKNTRGSVIGDILFYSLLSDKVKKILSGEPGIASTMARLGKTVRLPRMKNRQLSEIFLREGLKGLEEKFTAAVLEYIVMSEMHPVIKRFFTYLADTRNVIAAYKHVKWNISDKPVLVNGGNIRKAVLVKALQDRDTDRIISIAGRLAGVGLTEEAAPRIENTLLARLSKQAHAVGRVSDIGFILHYLWSVYIEARNLGIIFYGREIEGDTVKKELII